MDLAKKQKIRKLREDRAFHIVNAILLAIIASFCIIPFFNIIALSFSSAGYNSTVSFFPKGFTLYSYGKVLENLDFYKSFLVSVLVTLLGVILSLTVLLFAAYPLSKKDLPFRKVFMVFFIVVMLFSGGIVPNFLLVKSLGLLNTPMALVLPSLVQVYNLILIKNYLEGLPEEIEESAKIDGASYVRILIMIILPVSVPMLLTIALFTAVTYWNNYFSALIYLPNAPQFYPLPMYILNMIKASGMDDIMGDTTKALHKKNIESATILLSIVPIVATYPFCLKYFTKGIVVGAVKG